MDKQQEFVLRTLEERDIRFVRLWFTDVLGFLKSVAVAPAELEQAFDEGIGERFDVAAAIELAEFHDLPHLWLVGWSFGTELALRYGRDPAVEGAILLSPPLRRATDDDLAAWAAFGRPLVALVPEHDDFLVPAQAEPHFAGLANAEMIAVAGARHLWVGEAQVRRVLDEIVAHVLPGHGPLPTTWDGPSTQAPGSADRTGEDA